MKVLGAAATADILGRRVKISWEVALAAGEGLDKGPAVKLRRKQRDFEFPAAAATDPYLVYDSASLSPAGTTVTEVDLGETRRDGLRTTTIAQSVARRTGDVSVEVLRRTRSISYDQSRRPVRYREEIIDVGGRAEGLDPGVTCYYELRAQPPAGGAPTIFRLTATPTGTYGAGRAMYELLPAIIRRHDVAKAPARATGSIPEATGDGGQLRRFVDVFGAGVDHLRGRAEGLRGLHDVDTVDHRMLEPMASMLGWDLSHDKPIPLQRHEIKFAAQLYRVTGTLPGCAIWVKRLSGWDATIKEQWRNVLFTNDLGNPDDPQYDPGSRTLAMSARITGTMGTRLDEVDYVCDTGSGPGARYGLNAVGVFVRPGPLDTPADIVRKRARIVNGARLFLPFNMRAVVMLEAPSDSTSTSTTLGLTATQDESR